MPIAYIIGIIITAGIAIFAGYVATWRLAVSVSKEYTDKEVKAIRELHQERIGDLKKEIRELKDEVKDLSKESRQQNNKIIELLTLANKNK